MNAFAHHYVRQGNARGEHFHPRLAGFRLGAILHDRVKLVRTAVATDDDARMLHGVPPEPIRVRLPAQEGLMHLKPD